MLRRRPKTLTGKYRLYCNLGYNLTEEVVRRYFQQLCAAGQVLDVYIPRHNSGRNKGYGFATFELEGDLLRVLREPEHVIEGNVVKINRAGPRPQYGEKGLQQDQMQATAHGKGPRLYVGGIPDEVQEEDIKQHFNQWGNVIDIYFPGKSGLKRVNYCFVTFDTWHAAQQSCNESDRLIANKLVQAICLAEERTADIRKLMTLDAAASDMGGGLYDMQNLPDWSLDFGNLTLQHHPPSAPPLRGPQGRMALDKDGSVDLEPHQGLGAPEDTFRAQLLLQAMQQQQEQSHHQQQQQQQQQSRQQQQLEQQRQQQKSLWLDAISAQEIPHSAPEYQNFRGFDTSYAFRSSNGLGLPIGLAPNGRAQDDIYSPLDVGPDEERLLPFSHIFSPVALR